MRNLDIQWVWRYACACAPIPHPVYFRCAGLCKHWLALIAIPSSCDVNASSQQVSQSANITMTYNMPWLQVPSLQLKVDCIPSNYLVTNCGEHSANRTTCATGPTGAPNIFAACKNNESEKRSEKKTLNLVPRCQSWRFGLGTLSKCGQGTKCRKGCTFHKMQGFWRLILCEFSWGFV